MKARTDRHEIVGDTPRTLRQSLRLFSDFCGRDREMGSVTRQDVLRWAVLEGHLQKDPTLGVRGPRKTRSVTRSVSHADVRRLFAATTTSRERLMVVLMLEGGLRAIEVAGLELRDLDLDGGVMHVRGKGGHERWVPMTDSLHGAVLRYLLRRGRRPGPLMLAEGHGGHTGGISARHVVRMVGEAMRRSGINESGHALRHKFAHDFLEAGGSIRELQQLLGHASLATTQVYMGWATAAELRVHMGTRRYDEEAS